MQNAVGAEKLSKQDFPVPSVLWDERPAKSDRVNRDLVNPPTHPEGGYGRLLCVAYEVCELRGLSLRGFLIVVRQAVEEVYTQDHDEQANRHDDQQREPKPTEHHSTRPDTGMYATVAKVLGDLRCGDGRRVLPEHADEHEDGGDEDVRQGDLGDGAAGEGLDVDVGAGAGIVFFVPTGEGGEEEKSDEGEDDGDDEQIREDDLVLERLGDPDQVQRILVNADLLREQSGVVGAEEATAVRVDADAEVADADFEHRLSDNVGDGGCDAGVDLCRVVCGGVVIVVEGYEEDT